MFRSFMRSSGPIALLLVLGICTLPAVAILPVSTSTVDSDGTEITSGPDLATLIVASSLTVLGLLAFVAAGYLTYRRRSRRA